MPWWTRVLGEPDADVERNEARQFAEINAELAKSQPVEGPTAPGECSAFGCAESHVWPCAYVDSKGAHCPTRWCTTHLALYDGRAFCRRHAGTAQALGEVDAVAAAVDNRSPALAEWVGRDLNVAILDCLNAVRDEYSETIMSDRVRPVGDAPVRRWARAWRLVGADDAALVVAIEVDEAEPPVVRAVVAEEVVAEQVPPWITARSNDSPLAPRADAAARQDFSVTLQDAIAQAVLRHRPPTGGVTFPARD